MSPQKADDSLPLSPSWGPGDGEDVAGEGGGEQVASWDIVRIELMDIAQVEMVGTEVGLVHFEFIGVDVVGKGDTPVLPFNRQANRPMPAKNSAAQASGRHFSLVVFELIRLGSSKTRP